MTIATASWNTNTVQVALDSVSEAPVTFLSTNGGRNQNHVQDQSCSLCMVCGFQQGQNYMHCISLVPWWNVVEVCHDMHYISLCCVHVMAWLQVACYGYSCTHHDRLIQLFTTAQPNTVLVFLFWLEFHSSVMTCIDCICLAQVHHTVFFIALIRWRNYHAASLYCLWNAHTRILHVVCCDVAWACGHRWFHQILHVVCVMLFPSLLLQMVWSENMPMSGREGITRWVVSPNILTCPLHLLLLPLFPSPSSSVPSGFPLFPKLPHKHSTSKTTWT